MAAVEARPAGGGRAAAGVRRRKQTADYGQHSALSAAGVELRRPRRRALLLHRRRDGVLRRARRDAGHDLRHPVPPPSRGRGRACPCTARWRSRSRGRSSRWCIAMVMFFWGATVFFDDGEAAAERDGDLHGRQAVDVEVPARHRAARDQRAARPGRAAGQAAHRLRGRHPLRLRPGVPREDGRGARQDDDAVVHADEAGALPPVLRRVLRPAALRR